MGLPESQAELSDTIIVESLKGPRTVERHYGVITQVTDSGVWAYLDGATAAPVGPLLYSGSVPPPNVGESWAFDVVQREWIAVFRLNAGLGTSDVFDLLGAASAAQTNAQSHSDLSIDCTHNVPGLLPASTTLANCPPYEVHGRVQDATTIHLVLMLAVPDSSGDGVTWTWYYNGQATLLELTVPTGATSIGVEIPVTGFGQAGASIQGVLAYSGSTAASLTAHLRVF